MKDRFRSNHNAFGATLMNSYSYHQLHSPDATESDFEGPSPPSSFQQNGGSLAFIAVKADNLSKIIGSLCSALPPGCQIFVSESCERAPPFPDDGVIVVSSSRQLQILALLQEDLSNKEIGRLLNISHFTVRNQISQLLRIFGVSSRKDVIRKLDQIEC